MFPPGWGLWVVVVVDHHHYYIEVQSVAAATARAINAAQTAGRFGDIIGIVEAASLD
jgi:hypothetical protein